MSDRKVIGRYIEAKPQHATLCNGCTALIYFYYAEQPFIYCLLYGDEKNYDAAGNVGRPLKCLQLEKEVEG